MYSERFRNSIWILFSKRFGLNIYIINEIIVMNSHLRFDHNVRHLIVILGQIGLHLSLQFIKY